MKAAPANTCLIALTTYCRKPEQQAVHGLPQTRARLFLPVGDGTLTLKPTKEQGLVRPDSPPHGHALPVQLPLSDEQSVPDLLSGRDVALAHELGGARMQGKGGRMAKTCGWVAATGSWVGGASIALTC